MFNSHKKEKTTEKIVILLSDGDVDAGPGCGFFGKVRDAGIKLIYVVVGADYSTYLRRKLTIHTMAGDDRNVIFAEGFD
ncbi:hypothetical protein OSTOST_18608, partial [Ostertagia ostertagi]